MDTICVSNMPDYYNEIIVKDIFSRYGEVINIDRPKDQVENDKSLWVEIYPVYY